MKAFQHASILFLILVFANLSSIRIAYSEEAPAIEWQKTFLGSTYHEYGESLQQTADGGYIIAGETNQRVLLLKVDSSGVKQWSAQYGNQGTHGNSVQQTADEGYIITGSYAGGGNQQVVLAKTDSEGTQQWIKYYGGVLYTQQSNGNSVRQTSDGGYIVAGKSEESGCGVLLLKTYASGVTEWEQNMSGTGPAYAVQQIAGGDYIVAGLTAGLDDVQLFKTTPSGSIDWNHSFGGAGIDRAYAMQQTIDGGYIIAGDTESFGSITSTAPIR